MKILKLILLVFLLWGLPTFIQYIYGEGAGSLTSYLSFILLALYFFLSVKGKPVIPFIILGILYFTISGVINVIDPTFFIRDFVKYLIMIICGVELARNSTHKELFYVLLFGAASIFINAIFFQQGFGGRYSGIYLNPNAAGFICIVGYCLGYGIKNNILRILGQFLFVFAGILTLSRTFILLWVIVSIYAAFTNRKHFITIGIGVFTLLFLFSISSFLNLDRDRFNALEGLTKNKIDSRTITDDSRSDTWTLYTNPILNNVLLGNGYHSMQGMGSKDINIKVGVHNTYLMILGESGIVPFLIMLFILANLFRQSIIKHYRTNPEYFYITFVLAMFLLTTHNFFDNSAILIIALWLYTKINDTQFNNIN